MYDIKILTKKEYLEFLKKKDVTIVKDFAAFYFLFLLRFVVVYTLKKRLSEHNLLLYLNDKIGQKNYKMVKAKSNTLYLTLFFGAVNKKTKITFRISNHQNDDSYNFDKEILTGNKVDAINLSEDDYNKITKTIENPATYQNFKKKPTWMIENTF